MIEIEPKEALKLYKKIKDMIVEKKENQSYDYFHKQHHLYEESSSPGISRSYYNECGSVEFKNLNGNKIELEICRWHPHQHNGCSGLNSNPCLKAAIYKKKTEGKNDKKKIWELDVESRTLYCKAMVSSLELPPYDVLKEEETSIDFNVQENESIEIIEEEKEENEILETRALFDEIIGLYQKYQSLMHKKEKLLKKREKEIEETRKKIMKFYSKKMKKNEEDIFSLKQELNDYDQLFFKYSTFDIDFIGQAIQQLVTIIECDEFLYKQGKHEFKKIVHGPMDCWDELFQTRVNLIVKKDKVLDFYESTYKTESVIEELVNNGDAILLSEQDINIQGEKNITFYTLEKEKMTCLVNFGKFDYIKEFIDTVIQYRFERHMVDFSEEDMLVLMKVFMIQKEDVIINNSNSKRKEKVLSLTFNKK